MNRELSMEFVRVTEAAAIACGRSVGRGDKNGADQLAVDAMRKAFDTVNISGTVVIGEGEMDEAPMLYIGEKVGGGGAEVDIAVDPVEGTNLVAKGQPGAIAVIAIAPKGCLLHAPDMYMDKIAVGPRAKGCIDIDAPVSENLERVAKALERKVSDLTVVLLDRERHYGIMDEIRRAHLSVSHRPVFLLNSCLSLFSAATSLWHPLSRSYRVILPSSLTMLLPPALGFSPHPPVSVYGTGTYHAIAAFLDSSNPGLRYFNSLRITSSAY